MRPLIAIPGIRTRSASALRFSGVTVPDAILEAVFRAGGEPVVVGSARPGPYEGVLLPGGADVAPERYGVTREAATEPSDPAQDELDLAVARAALAAGTPALAICRGLQVVNVATGGTLVQHVAGHKDVLHEVAVVAGSRLGKAVGAERVTVSSYHHQVVDRPGAGLTVSAYAPDGGVEAVETADLLAVQWHPEDLAATSRTDQALFDDLVERARSRAGRV